jgi:predicted branched-subunit amino acid permease
MLNQFHKQGIKAMLPNSIAVGLWGIATGIAMGQSSLTMWQAIMFAVFAYAGSAQLVSLPLFASHAPIFFIWLAAFIVNTRFLIFSAGLQPYFSHLSFKKRLILGYLNGDMIYLEFMRHYPMPAKNVDSQDEQESFFWGACVINYIVWQFWNIFGIVFAQLFKPEWQIGFLGTLALVPILINTLKDKSFIVITLLSLIVSSFFYWLPFRLPLLIAVFSSMLMAFAWQFYIEKSSKSVI